MFEVHINHHTLEDFLTKQSISKCTKRNHFYLFLTKEHFVSIVSSYFFISFIREIINELNEEMELKDDWEQILPSVSKEELENDIQAKLMKYVHSKTFTYSFDPDAFETFRLYPIKNRLVSTFYETLSEMHRTDHLTNQTVFTSKLDILYVVILENGGMELRHKNSTILKTFSYNEQEHAIAQIVHLNPELTIVYDHLNLLNPELVICLKKFLKKKVEFIEEKFASP